MLAHHKEAAANGFRHLSRPLAEGETLPRLPTLVEQVLACRFEPHQAEPEETADDEDWDEDSDGLE